MIRGSLLSVLGLLFCFGFYGNAQDLSWKLIKREGMHILQLEAPVSRDDWDQEDFQVYVGEKAEWPGAGTTSVLGKVWNDGASLFFLPRFPFRETLTYTAFWKKQYAYTFSIPVDVPPAGLLAIYPSADALPANLLKIYLHFSAPMGEGRAYEHLTLINSVGDTVYQPFVPLQPELWSADRQRLTLWLDPGRIKRGLLSHAAHGVVIEEDEVYTLWIDAAWKDASGQPLGKSSKKVFRVVSPDYDQPQLVNWSYEFPAAGTLEPLIINFGESMDHALASRLLAVFASADTKVAGTVVLRGEESRWIFHPEAPWRAGDYTIRIDSALEDLAGNNLNRPFDRELAREEPARPAKDHYTIPFKIKDPE